MVTKISVSMALAPYLYQLLSRMSESVGYFHDASEALHYMGERDMALRFDHLVQELLELAPEVSASIETYRENSGE